MSTTMTGITRRVILNPPEVGEKVKPLSGGEGNSWSITDDRNYRANGINTEYEVKEQIDTHWPQKWYYFSIDVHTKLGRICLPADWVIFLD